MADDVYRFLSDFTAGVRRGLDVVQQMLRSGWTTLRILGDADVAYAHLDVRTAIQEGLMPRDKSVFL